MKCAAKHNEKNYNVLLCTVLDQNRQATTRHCVTRHTVPEGWKRHNPNTSTVLRAHNQLVKIGTYSVLIQNRALIDRVVSVVQVILLGQNSYVYMR